MDEPMTVRRQRVDSAIRDAVASALPEQGVVDFDAVLTSDVGLDSVQVMDLVMEIEDRLEISVPVEVLAEVRTLNELAAKLETMIGDAPA
jgi:acyl carrier protein